MKRNEDYILRMISDIPLLMSTKKPVDNRWIFEINSMGKYIWEQCENCTAIEELLASISQYCHRELDKNETKAIIDYVNQLYKWGLLEDERRL